MKYPISILLFILIIANANCRKKSDNIPPTNSNLGQEFQGGIIIYEDGNGHGIIAAPADIEGTWKWHEYNGSITHPTTETSIGSGLSNTEAILSIYGTEINAARICYDLELNGYSDWYLPSKDELNEIYKNQKYLTGIDTSFWPPYWSSSYQNAVPLNSYQHGAWSQFFNNGQQGTVGFNKVCRVRPIRSY